MSDPVREQSQAASRFVAPPFGAASGDGAGLRSEAGIAELLRQRLRVLSIGIAVLALPLTALVGAMGGFAHPSAAFTKSPYLGWALPWGIAIAIGGQILLAPARRRLSLVALRVIEVVGIGSGVLLYTFASTLALINVPVDQVRSAGPLDALGPSVALSAFWVSTMIAYGVYIPNTWRRVAWLMLLMVVCATVPDAIVLLVRGAPPAAFWTYMAARALWLADAGAIAIFGAYRISTLERAASEARQLGQYTLKARLGQGGMGEVYLAEHRLLRRPCAVKLVRPADAADGATLARFEREVQSTAALTHPNTVQVFDYGRADDGTFYYAMELLPGLSLEQLIDRHGPMPARRATHLLVQLCGALSEAHDKGIVHRDVKPSNVIVCERGGKHDVAKLLDFGLVAALAPSAEEARLTQAGVVVGTPAFMSPEQCSGDEVGPASDLYSLGALAYYILTGKVLFEGKTPMQMLAAHIYESPRPMSAYGVTVSREFEDAIMHCLAKAPADRLASAGQLEAALQACASADPWTESDARNWWGVHGTTALMGEPA